MTKKRRKSKKKSTKLGSSTSSKPSKTSQEAQEKEAQGEAEEEDGEGATQEDEASGTEETEVKASSQEAEASESTQEDEDTTQEESSAAEKDEVSAEDEAPKKKKASRASGGDEKPAKKRKKSGSSKKKSSKEADASAGGGDKEPPTVIGWRAWWEGFWPTGDGIDDRNVQYGIFVVASLVYLTRLGFGLWDCWEPHYAETARMMLVRKDWVHPYWGYAYFLSKPILMFWYMAASMSIFGVTEWAIRLPFALHAIFLIWAVYYTTSRLFSMRAGLLAAIVVGTAPLTTFLGRQAIVDIIVTSYITAGLGFFALAIFGRRQDREAAAARGELPPLHLPYLYFFYFLAGLTLLAKGLMGAGLIGFIVVGYLLVSQDWGLLLRCRLLTGSLLTLIIALPWYIHMSFFPGRNIDDHKTFWTRFILHDNIFRLFRGVHGEKGTFVYFVRQLGYALGTWVGFLPVALLSYGRFRTQPDAQGNDKPDLHEKLRRFLFCWWMCSFLLFSLSQTKFHHYVFPIVPISGILIALWLDRFLSRESFPLYRVSLIFVLGVFAMVFRDVIRNPHHLVNMFVYKYSRAYPWSDPMVAFGLKGKLSLGFTTLNLGLTPQMVLRDIMLVAVFFMLIGFFYNLRKAAVWGLCGLAGFFAVYNAQSFMISLTPHWSQKHFAETVKKHSPLWRKLLKNPMADTRKDPIPAEPLFAFRMNWRGEKFYFRSRDIQILGTFSYDRQYQSLQRNRRPGRPVFFLTEASRMKELRRAVGHYDAKRLRIIDRSNNKYLLVKLLPKPPHERQSKSQIARDARNRKYYDDWVRKWRRNKRRKARNKRKLRWNKKGRKRKRRTRRRRSRRG